MVEVLVVKAITKVIEITKSVQFVLSFSLNSDMMLKTLKTTHNDLLCWDKLRACVCVLFYTHQYSACESLCWDHDSGPVFHWGHPAHLTSWSILLLILALQWPICLPIIDFLGLLSQTHIQIQQQVWFSRRIQEMLQFTDCSCFVQTWLNVVNGLNFGET